MPSRFIALSTFVSWSAGLFLLSACEGIQLGGDALSMNLPPRQAQTCRDATWEALAERNVTPQWARRVHYQAIRASSRTGSNPLRGFEAWVYPRTGRGVLVVELNASCQVRAIRQQGTRGDFR